MSTPRQRSLEIETPEGVVFRYQLATPALRALAWAVDVAALGTAAYVIGKAADSFGSLSADWAGALSAVLFFLATIGYGIVLEWRWRGQTLGKRLLRLRVVDAQGLRLQFPQVALRNLLRLVDMLPLVYLVGGTASLLTRRCQRLGDLAANTVVAREPVFKEPDLEQIAPAKYNSLLAYPHLAARLRSLSQPCGGGLRHSGGNGARQLRPCRAPGAFRRSGRVFPRPGAVPARRSGRPYRRAVRAQRAASGDGARGSDFEAVMYPSDACACM